MAVQRNIDIAGEKFGRLTVIERAHIASGRKLMWLCQCDCGKAKTIRGGSLRAGVALSCGCLQPEVAAKAATIHGCSYHAEYGVWRGMIERCTNPNATGWKNYGGRGISVCERWSAGFQPFFDDMGRRPTDAHSIDRINNDGNYEPGNCRWATAKEQAANRRPKRFIVPKSIQVKP